MTRKAPGEVLRLSPNGCVSSSPIKHRLVRAERTAPDDKMPLGGMNWDCACGAKGWCSADMVEAVWHAHEQGLSLTGLTAPLGSFAYTQLPRARPH